MGDSRLARLSSVTERSSVSTLRESRERRPTEPLSMLASTPARWSLSSSRWTRIARTFLIAEPRVVLRLWARIRASTLRRVLPLPWRLHKHKQLHHIYDDDCVNI